MDGGKGEASPGNPRRRGDDDDDEGGGATRRRLGWVRSTAQCSQRRDHTRVERVQQPGRRCGGAGRSLKTALLSSRASFARTDPGSLPASPPSRVVPFRRCEVRLRALSPDRGERSQSKQRLRAHFSQPGELFVGRKARLCYDVIDAATKFNSLERRRLANSELRLPRTASRRASDSPLFWLSTARSPVSPATVHGQLGACELTVPLC